MTDKPLKILWIQEQLYADFESGQVYWKVNKKGPGAKVGKSAGTLRSNGYYQITINGCTLRRSHVIWALKHGEFPPDELDHRDRNPSNDSLTNLRPATSSLNKVNQKIRSDNLSRFRGVYQRKDSGRWTAQICLNGRRETLGCFSSKDEAADAYKEASRLLHKEFSTVC